MVLLRRSILVGAVSCLLQLAGLIERSSDWTSLGFRRISVMVALMASLVLLIGLNKGERDSLVLHPATHALRFVGLIQSLKRFWE